MCWPARTSAIISVRNWIVGSKTDLVVDWCGECGWGSAAGRKGEGMAAKKAAKRGVSALVVRVLEAGDAEAVVELTGQLGYERSKAEVEKWIEGLDERAGTQTAFVACVGDEIAGWIEVSMERRLQTAPFALIGGLVVKDGMRGAGIGRRLCEEAERWSVGRGARVIRVTSRSTREDAHRFYQRDGYAMVKTSVVFEKKLGV